MHIGDLRHRITIQERVVGQDSEGFTTETFADIATVWAAVQPLTMKSREFYTAQAITGEVTTQITMRYLSGITPKHRILYGTHVFDIQVVLDVEERHREMQLFCREVIAGG